jgi:hypothetical protein
VRASNNPFEADRRAGINPLLALNLDELRADHDPSFVDLPRHLFVAARTGQNRAPILMAEVSEPSVNVMHFGSEGIACGTDFDFPSTATAAHPIAVSDGFLNWASVTFVNGAASVFASRRDFPFGKGFPFRDASTSIAEGN